MTKTFVIPGYDVVLQQSENSQAVTDDSNFVYLKAKQLLERDTEEKIKSVLDLGTGCGIILLMIAKNYARLTYTGVEIVPHLADMAEDNFRNFTRFIGERDYEIHNADFCMLDAVLGKRKYDLIVSNPPYYRKGAGKLSSVYEKAVARYEIKCTLIDLFRNVKGHLAEAGILLIIYPLSRKGEVEKVCEELGFEIRSVEVTDYGDNKARVLFEIAPPHLTTRTQREAQRHNNDREIN
jgi:tRNA1(Val) A37 N6-methylase TrmN6